MIKYLFKLLLKLVLFVIIAFGSFYLVNKFWLEGNTDDDADFLLYIQNIQKEVPVYTEHNRIIHLFSGKELRFVEPDMAKQLLMNSSSIIGEMKKYLVGENNLIMLPEVFPHLPYSLVLISLHNVSVEHCNKGTLLDYVLFNKMECHNKIIKKNYELLFNPCIVGESTGKVLVEEILNPYKPFQVIRELRSKSLKVCYHKIVIGFSDRHFVCEWMPYYIGVELEGRIKRFTKQQKIKTNCLYNL